MQEGSGGNLSASRESLAPEINLNKSIDKVESNKQTSGVKESF